MVSPAVAHETERGPSTKFDGPLSTAISFHSTHRCAVEDDQSSTKCSVTQVRGKAAHLRAVSDDEERLSIDLEGLDVIGFANLQNVNILDLDELVGRDVTFVNVGAAEQLCHDDKQVVVNHHGLADYSGCA